MHFDCAIAVFDDFGKSAEGVRRLQSIGIEDQQVNLVTHDAAAEIPSGAAVQESGGGVQSHAAIGAAPADISVTADAPNERRDANAGSLAQIGNAINNLLAGDFFSGLAERLGTSDPGSAQTINDYQRLLGEGCLLLVVTGSREDVERAAQALSATESNQVNIHYSSEPAD